MSTGLVFSQQPRILRWVASGPLRTKFQHVKAGGENRANKCGRMECGAMVGARQTGQADNQPPGTVIGPLRATQLAQEGVPVQRKQHHPAGLQHAAQFAQPMVL